MTIAKGYDRLGIELKDYISRYTPCSWIVPISNVAHTPWIMTPEARILAKAHEANSLDKALEGLGDNFKSWYVREAIKDYFSKGEYTKLFTELEEDESSRL